MRKGIFVSLVFITASLGAMERAPGLLDIQWSEVPPAERVVQLRSSNGGNSVPSYDSQSFDQVRLPVLLPEMSSQFTKVQTSAQENAYDVSITLAGARVLVSGDRFFQHAVGPEFSGAKVLTATKEPVFSLNANMPELGFSRYGANYSLTLECDDYTDSRCANDAYIRALYQGLQVVGGKP